MTIGAACQCAASDGVTLAVNRETGLDQRVFDSCVVNSVVGMILGQISCANYGSVVSIVAWGTEFAESTGEAGKKISAIVKQLCNESVDRGETIGGKRG
jgi:hypothetical protein